jgi:Lar family restriction alleviation protein
MTIELPKLAPCPFCGGEAKYHHRQPGGTGASGMEPSDWWISCGQCGVKTPWFPAQVWERGKYVGSTTQTLANLAARWNRRSALK